MQKTCCKHWLTKRRRKRRKGENMTDLPLRKEMSMMKWKKENEKYKTLCSLSKEEIIERYLYRLDTISSTFFCFGFLLGVFVITGVTILVMGL